MAVFIFAHIPAFAPVVRPLFRHKSVVLHGQKDDNAAFHGFGVNLARYLLRTITFSQALRLRQPQGLIQ